MPRKAAKTRAPSVAGLRQLRAEMLRILRSLRDAQARSRDVGDRARIQRVLLEVGNRAGGLAAALDTVAAMRARQESYQVRIDRLDERIESLVGRKYRGSERWLRRWKNL